MSGSAGMMGLEKNQHSPLQQQHLEVLPSHPAAPQQRAASPVHGAFLDDLRFCVSDEKREQEPAQNFALACVEQTRLFLFC